MSFLAWAFGLGALAVAFPIFFHLIRKTPTGRQEFSSLMFLQPSPPRLTKRSRLDNLLLLLLRAAVIALLAFAFMRPFFRQSVNLISSDVPARRVAILLDTSASMRTGDLWKVAKAKAREALQELESTDDVAFITFDHKTKTIVDFEKELRVAPREKHEVIRSEIEQIKPGWAQTDLAGALVSVANQLDLSSDSSEKSAALQVVLISDFQKGALVDSLQSFQWPKSVKVDVRVCQTKTTDNATVRVLNSKRGQSDPELPRVRVTNADNSTNDQFYVAFSNDGKFEQSEATPYYVPPGTSRVLAVKRALENDRILLGGDEVDFDNQFFSVPVEQQQMSIVYFGDEEPDDADRMLYYLKSAFLETPSQRVHFIQVQSDDAATIPNRADLFVIANQLSPLQQKNVDQHLASGGTAVVVLTSNEQVESVKKFIGNGEVVESSKPAGDDALLAEINFQHPLLMPLSSSRYNDFTQIHFWKRVSVRLPESNSVQVIARFDDETPAIWQTRIQTGTVYTLASGWDPASSQLALGGAKFVPLMTTILRFSNRIPEFKNGYIVGEPIALPKTKNKQARWSIQRPDGKTDKLTSAVQSYVGADMPGIYEMQTPEFGDKKFRFAVNVSPLESQTAPMAIEKLKMHNVAIGRQDTRQARIQQVQKLQDQEVENRQKIWKWLVVAAFAILLFETWLAGLKSLRAANSGESSQQVPTVTT